MKRFIVFLMCAVMLCAQIPAISVSAEADTDMIVYDPFGEDAGLFKTVSITVTPVTEADGRYLHLVANPGSYRNIHLILSIQDPNIAILEYPYVKMEYKSDSKIEKIDTTFVGAKGESWGSTHPELKGDGEWHSFVWDLNNIKLPAECVPAKDEKNVALRFKFWGDGEKTLTEASYFDIKYVTLFKTKEAAEKFDFSTYNSGNDPEYTVDPDIIKEGSAKLEQYNKECDELIEKIKNTPTTVTVSGTKYYVSADGNDSNDGKSPATAWKSIRKVSDTKLNPGDGVFFKRGDHFRADGVSLKLQTGVTYSAYGDGDKPVLIGSVDASNPSNWFETDVPNVYKYAYTVNNVGSIIINGGQHWGIRLTKKNDQNVTLDNGIVNNGLDAPYHSESRPWDGYKSLKNNLEFVSFAGTYLYCKDGNPADVFESIEISEGITGVNGSAQNVVFDNIKLFGYGVHGIGVGNAKNFKVTNCIFGWIGGSIQSGDVRLGNAVQNWKNCEDFVIDHCWSYQIYDCCYTTQYTGDMSEKFVIKNLEFSNNVAEYSNSGPEIWNGKSINDDKSIVTYDNVIIRDSYTRNNGYGWSHQRPSKDGNFFYGAFHSNPTFNNVRFVNNKFFIASSIGLKSQYISEDTMGFVDNEYILAKGKIFADSVTNVKNGTGIGTKYYYTPENIAKLQSQGVERDGEFYYVEADYVPEPFDYKAANDNYTSGYYTDTTNHWAKAYVKSVSNAGLFKGVSADKFDPDGAMTRAMVYTVLSRFDHKNVQGGAKWYDGAVSWAIENAITTEALARPEANITRGELALMIYKYMTGKHLTVDNKPVSYKDSASFKAIDGADLATVKKALDYCASAGLIMGDDAGNMRFNAPTKRSEVAAVFARMYDFVANAKIDTSNAKEQMVMYKAEQLEKLLSTSWASKELTEQDGVKYMHYLPRTTKGTVELSLGQWSIPEIDMYDYQYMKIKYRINTIQTELDVNVRTNDLHQWLAAGSIARPDITACDEWIFATTRLCDFDNNVDAKTVSGPNKNMNYIVKPFGDNANIPEGSYIDIESIAFFNNEFMAKAYEW
ncbi:MAG: S-layer homology domain-containing protein [Clostridia bacterium]|nr:S-layer homology domain-containing protein [Clostridia bacterium]